MTLSNSSPPAPIGISAVERDTGLSKDTLRVWERRYGFPSPGRDANGERTYPLDQVDKLRALKRLMDNGHRPGKIIHHALADLHVLAERIGMPSAKDVPGGGRGDGRGSGTDDLTRYLDLVRQHRVEDMRRALSQTLLGIGLARFVSEIVAPLNTLVGEAWTRGQLQIFEEHLYTESVQVILRNAINTIPEPGQSPRILLTTFPQEPHGIGLLMAEALFTLDGCRCISLGVQTPIPDIVLAATTQQADVVALSFSPTLNANQVIDGLLELRAKLPPATEIWAGGSCPALRRRAPEQVRALVALEDIHGAIADWRARHA